jgi:putative flippase GtrA
MEPVPLLGLLATAMLRVQQQCWRYHPDLVERVSDFLPIGGVCTLFQACLLFLLKQEGASTIAATTVAVELSIVLSFILNKRITWKDRFQGFSPRTLFLWTPLVFLTFNALNPAVYTLIVGLNTLEKGLGIPFFFAWSISQLGTITVSFLGIDRVAFGLIPRLLQS